MSRHPDYQLIYSDLLRRFQTGFWKIGDKFPTPRELKGQYGSSPCTIFKAVRMLLNDGYLEVKGGRGGTVVARTTPVQNIGLLMSEPSLEPQKSPFAYVFGRKVTSVLKDAGFSVSRYIERSGTEFHGRLGIENFAAALKNRSLSGLVMASCNFPRFMDKCPVWQEFAVPHVIIGESELDGFKVDFDADRFLQLAFEYFSEKGRRKVALLCGDNYIAAAMKAKAGFPELQVAADWSVKISTWPNPEQNGFEAMLKLWSRKKHPDGLLVSDDVVTKGVVQAAFHLGIRIPEDLLVVHHANSDSNIFYPVKMPKIEYDMDEIAAAAVGQLRLAVAKFKPTESDALKMIKPRLVEVTA